MRGIGAWLCFVCFRNNLAPCHYTDSSCSFMRPNCLHYVLTEQPSIVYGNYFFACSAIQQTVLGWVHTHMLGMLVTNVELVETRRILVRMMCVWAHMIQVRHKDKRDRPHVPMVETRDGFLDILALGNLLIFMQCFTYESEQDSLELKLGVAAYTNLMIWLDCNIALESLEGTGSLFSAARIAFRRSAEHFGLALLGYQKYLRKNPKFYGNVPKRYRLRICHLEPDICKVYEEVFQETLVTSAPSQPGELNLLWAPTFGIKKWEGGYFTNRRMLSS